MKISFCITCKNRLFYLKQTLPISLLNSSDFLDKEFVILDYNSEDGLHDWAKKHLHYWERCGVVKYLRTETPKYFCAAHAKNISHKNATGDILCNLDCDNFVLNGFCQYLSEIFENKSVIFCSDSADVFGNHGCCGKIATRKDVFYSVNGYDESKEVSLGWGWDDVNFRFRAKNHNNLDLLFGELKYNMTIGHSNEVRSENFPVKNVFKTRDLSIEWLKRLNTNKNFVANKGKNWGFIEDLKIGLT